MAEQLAAALDVPIAPGQSADETLRRSLEYRPTLIVADDIDRLDGAAAWLINLVKSNSDSRLLATAAGAFDHPGERVVRVGALSAQAGSVDNVSLFDDPAVRLFADRAAAVDHTFRLDRANIRQVAELCALLDRLPLAIELAAARSPTLSPGAQLRLLSRGTALDIAHVSVHSGRTRVLRDTIAMSHDLVPIDAQRLLRRMAVFDSGMSIAALAAVCAPESTESRGDRRLDAARRRSAGRTGQPKRGAALPAVAVDS